MSEKYTEKEKEISLFKNEKNFLRYLPAYFFIGHKLLTKSLLK